MDSVFIVMDNALVDLVPVALVFYSSTSGSSMRFSSGSTGV